MPVLAYDSIYAVIYEIPDHFFVLMQRYVSSDKNTNNHRGTGRFERFMLPSRGRGTCPFR